MKNIFQKIDMWIAYIVIWFIRIYQVTISPDKWILSFFLKWKICCHEPHCSKYSIQILKRYWFTNWIFKVFDRVSRCTWSAKKIYDPPYYKVVFFSWAPIWIPFLRSLNDDKKFDLVWVVTMPDKPRGRWMTLQKNIIKSEAIKIKKELDGDSNKVLLYKCSWKEIIDAIELSDKIAREEKTQDAFIKNVRAIILDKDWKVLRILRQEYNTREIPWWSVENWESLKNALGREVKEELWVNITKSKLIRARKRIWWVRWCSYYYIVQVDWKPQIKEPNKHSKLEYHKAKDIEFEWIYIDRMLKQKQLKIHDRSNFSFDIPKMETIELDKLYCQYFDTKKRIYLIELEDKNQTKDIDKFCITPRKLNPERSEEWAEFASWLKHKDPDFIVVIAYGKIISQAILDIPNIAPINVHGSLLPQYRGASPIQSVFLDKKQYSWITIMKMDAGMDTWTMIDKLKTKLSFNWTSKDLIERIKINGPKFLTKTLRNYAKWLLWEVPQQEADTTYCSKIEKENGEINPFKDSLSDIYAKYRAFAMWPKIYFILGDEFWKNKWKRVVIESLDLDEGKFNEFAKKELIIKNLDNQHHFSLNKATNQLLLKPEGKKKMKREDFLKGYYKKNNI